MTCRILRSTVLLAAVNMACAGADAAIECAPLRDGVDIVRLSAPDPARTIALEEVWRLDGMKPGQEIAEPAAVSVSRSGHTALVDFSLGEVAVIGPRGEWIGRWGRRGRGPGELTMPVAASWGGDTLVVYDIDQSKVARYRSGEALGDARIPPELSSAVVMSGMIGFVAVRSDGTVLLQQPLEPVPSPDSGRVTVLRAGPSSAADTLVSADVPTIAWDGGRMVHPAGAVPRIAVGPDNGVALSASDGSHGLLVDAGGATRQLCGAMPARPLSDEERGLGAAPAGFEDVAQALRAAREPRHPGAIGRVVILPDGGVWIDARRPRSFTRDGLLGRPGGPLEAYDADGEHLGTVIVPDNVAIQGVADSVVVGVEFDDLDVAWLIGYRIR